MASEVSPKGWRRHSWIRNAQLLSGSAAAPQYRRLRRVIDTLATRIASLPCAGHFGGFPFFWPKAPSRHFQGVMVSLILRCSRQSPNGCGLRNSSVPPCAIACLSPLPERLEKGRPPGAQHWNLLGGPPVATMATAGKIVRAILSPKYSLCNSEAAM